VDQYHEEKDGKKTIINLGRFDEVRHLTWLTSHPSKRPKPVATRKSVSHHYSSGDICDMTGKPRHVEVKLKCKKSDSPSAVSLYLLEPKTCEYVLGIESPLVCDIMHLADENGFMNIAKEDLDKPRSTITTTKTTITKSESPKVIVPPAQQQANSGEPPQPPPPKTETKSETFTTTKTTTTTKVEHHTDVKHHTDIKHHAPKKTSEDTRQTLSKIERLAREEVEGRLRVLEKTKQDLEEKLDLGNIMYDDDDEENDDEDLEEFDEKDFALP